MLLNNVRFFEMIQILLQNVNLRKGACKKQSKRQDIPGIKGSRHQFR